MKALFSEKLMEKFRKIPYFVWVLIFAAAAFAGNAVELFADSATLSAEIMEAYRMAGMSVRSEGVIQAAIISGSVVIAVLAFELIANWISGDLVRRYRLNVKAAELVMMVRILAIIINLVFGLFSLLYFVSEDAFYIADAIIEAPLVAGLFIWFFEAVRKRIAPAKFQSRLFSFVSWIYFAIAIVINGYYFLSYMFVYDVELTVIEIAALSLRLGMTLAMAAAAYIYSLKLKKHSDDDNNNDGSGPYRFEIIEEKNDTVFKDFDI